jgi:MFS family permease
VRERTAAGVETRIDGNVGGSWSELFRGRAARYTTLVLLGVFVYSIQTLVIVTTMPTVVQDLGGSAYYVWASMLYLVGTIVGAASVGPCWAAFGGRRVLALASAAFALGTLGCAISPDMASLVLSRSLQGYAGGLITGGGMTVVSRLFAAPQRTRILALYQGTWTVCSLLGPFFGGAFAEIGWWRGAFLSFVPIVLIYGVMAWRTIPDERSSAHDRRVGLPLVRLLLLACGVTAVAQAGQLEHTQARIGALVLAVGLLALSFGIDARSAQRLFPTRPLSTTRPVGLGYWLLIIVGGVQAAVTIFLPLSLQVVHEVKPLLVGVPSLVISTAWTIATFVVSDWTGSRERFALQSGPVLMLAGIAAMLAATQAGSVAGLLAACFLFGFGIGIHNVHLSARIMECAEQGEETVTASSMSMIRPLGMAVGTAAAGMVANMAGLGEGIRREVVNDAVLAVLSFSMVPLVFALLFIVRLTRLVVPGTGKAAPRRHRV